MKRRSIILTALLSVSLGVAALATQRDTNTTTTTTSYTPKAPGEILVGSYSNTPWFWVAGVGNTTNDWISALPLGVTTNTTYLKSTGVTGTLNVVNGVVTNRP